MEGTWGYLFPLDKKFGGRVSLKKRSFCPAPVKPLEAGSGTVSTKKQKDKSTYRHAEEKYEDKKDELGFPSGGYLIGRHPECDIVLDIPTISNRHCLLFSENKKGDQIAVVEDLSSNGTFVNEAIVGRNNRRELEDNDEITILDEARFVFRYPASRNTNAFKLQYRILQQLGKGHFATVYLCVEKSTGFKYAVKKFERRTGESQRSQTEGLQQEIGVLMSVSHPNVLCLKDTFDEVDGVYLVLELAAEGELFNWIVAKQKLSEDETRKLFIQLFQGIKYLHERNIVHRDIKPENILLTDKNLSCKLADFGLAKIIGEESFTTTLCGTPSCKLLFGFFNSNPVTNVGIDVAPEILENSRHRRYTRAVDVWSLGVVLYICLCGFPPFSDELYTRENPYTLAQQIKMGRFDYPSPYWDPVGDPALDLIDRMLTVDVEKRITIDQCLEHPWVTKRFEEFQLQQQSMTDSLDGLPSDMGRLDFSMRKLSRERTLLSSINNVHVTQVVDVKAVPQSGHLDGINQSVKVWEKNPEGKNAKATAANDKVPASGTKRVVKPKKEAGPAAARANEEFMQMGGKGDVQLFNEDKSSRYNKEEVPLP